MYFSIKYKKTINFIGNHFFCCNHTCCCVGMVSVTSASRYVTSVSRYQSIFSMYILGLMLWNSAELAEAVQIGAKSVNVNSLRIPKQCQNGFTILE